MNELLELHNASVALGFVQGVGCLLLILGGAWGLGLVVGRD